jgi:hypothetical protein
VRLEATPRRGDNRIETSVLANGIYTVRWTNGREVSAMRLAVRH